MKQRCADSLSPCRHPPSMRMGGGLVPGDRHTLTRRVCLGLCLSLLVGCLRLDPRSPGPAAKAKAPPFALPAHNSKTYSLAELIEDGPAIVVFYRGFW